MEFHLETMRFLNHENNLYNLKHIDFKKINFDISKIPEITVRLIFFWNYTKVGISFIKNLYVSNYKDCSYDSKNIWSLGKIPKKI